MYNIGYIESKGIPMSKNQEKDLQKIFETFEAKIELDTENMSVIQWQNKNGDMNHSMRFIIDNKKLIVTGDLGSNIFNWAGKGKLNIEWLSDLGEGYLFSKRESKDVTENLWDSDVCLSTAKEEILENEELTKSEAMTKIKELESDLRGEETENEINWANWLNNNGNGEKYFGDDYWESAYNFGINPDIYRHSAILVALKGISDQINNTIPCMETPKTEAETSTFTVPKY